MVLPDGLVLLGALSKCSDCLSQKPPQVAYRLNLMRRQLNLDRQPHANVILRYSEHLQAEAEDLMLGVGRKTVAAVKAVALGLEILVFQQLGMRGNPKMGMKDLQRTHASFG